jgi:AcrR family transcriptional regulator
MARPRSEDKRNAILAAATEVIAEQGVSAPTARIAKMAGVAEGSLFTYFNNKDDLLNQLYLELKAELRDEMMSSYPKAASLKSRARHVWYKYVEWGVSFPGKRKAMAQLSVSERITEQSKAAGAEAFGDINTMMQESVTKGVLRDHPPAFVAAIMGALADTTMDFVIGTPAQAELYREAGFEAFWHAIAKG